MFKFGTGRISRAEGHGSEAHGRRQLDITDYSDPLLKESPGTSDIEDDRSVYGSPENRGFPATLTKLEPIVIWGQT